MNLNIDLSKYLLPVLGIACVGGGLLAFSGMRTPAAVEPPDPADMSEARMPKNLELNSQIPTMEDVVAKHLFVPERVATGENSFPDLLVKGVYVGETERNAVFSLKSKPNANLRVWMGDEDAALAQVEDGRDDRQPIANFLGEWHIKSIDFSGVTVEHVITGEVETYAVDYSPQKHAKSSAGAGYGQGFIVDASAGSAKAAASRPAASSKPQQARPPSGSTQAIAGRVGQYMERLTPQQRQQFMQQLQKQNAAGKKNGGASSNNNNNSGNRRNNGNNNNSNNRKR